jgi:hypothetical protein
MGVVSWLFWAGIATIPVSCVVAWKFGLTPSWITYETGAALQLPSDLSLHRWLAAGVVVVTALLSSALWYPLRRLLRRRREARARLAAIEAECRDLHARDADRPFVVACLPIDNPDNRDRFAGRDVRLWPEPAVQSSTVCACQACGADVWLEASYADQIELARSVGRTAFAACLPCVLDPSRAEA